MKIAICGYSGLIGRAVSEYLSSNGHLVMAITRNDLAKGEMHIRQLLIGVDAVINLAGAPGGLIAGSVRYTTAVS